MANSIRWNKGSRLLLKGTLLILIGVALFSVINYSIIENTEDSNDQGLNAEANDVHLEKREVDDLAKITFDTSFRNPCFFENSGNLRCIPYVYVFGVEGDGLLFKAIQMHEDVLGDERKTNYFSKFRSISEITNSDIKKYELSFNREANVIRMEPNKTKKIICDRGDYFSRTYDLPEPFTHAFSAENTVAAILNHMDPSVKILFIFRDPSIGVYAEYCRNGGDAQLFSAKALSAVTKVKDCMELVEESQCVYNQQIIDEVGLNLGGFYYRVLMEHLIAMFPTTQFKYEHFDRFTDPNSINDVMADFFNFLEIPFPNIDFRECLTGGKLCNGIPMETATKTVLDNFFESSNERMAEIMVDDTFNYGNNHR